MEINPGFDNETEETAEETTEETVAETSEETAEETPEDSAEETSEETMEEDADGEASEEEYEEDENGELRMCPHCGVEHVAYGHEYCYKCETQLLKTKIPIVGWICAMLVLAASFFAFLLYALISAPALQVLNGDIKAFSNNWFSAYENYSDVSDVLSEITDVTGEDNIFSPFLQIGSGVTGKMFESIVHVYDPIQAYNYSSNLFTSANGYKESLKLYNTCEEYYNEYATAYTAISDVMTEVSSMDNPTPEDGEKFIKSVEECRGEDGVKDIWLDFFIYNLAGVCSMDDDTILGYLENVDKDNKELGGDYYWLYYTEYATALIAADRDDEAKPYLDALMSYDISDYDPVMLYCRIYTKAGDLDTMEDVINTYCNSNKTTDGAQSDSNYSLLINFHRIKGDYDEVAELVADADELYSLIPEFDRQQALAYLSQGKYDDAYESAYEAENKAYYRYYYYGDSTGYSDELLNTVYVAAVLCKEYGLCNTDNAQYIDDVIDSYEGSSSQTAMASIINGDVKVADYLSEGACDLI